MSGGDGEITGWILSIILDSLPGQWWKLFSLAGAFLTFIVSQLVEKSGFLGIVVGLVCGFILGVLVDVLVDKMRQPNA